MNETKNEVLAPIDMLLFCPQCGEQHIDEAKPDVCETCGLGFADCNCEAFTEWLNPPHKSHRCIACNHVWRPADAHTNGVLVTKTKGERDGNPRPRYFATAKDFNDSLEQLTEKLRGEKQQSVGDEVPRPEPDMPSAKFSLNELRQDEELQKQFLHLWSKAVLKPDYNKKEWQQFRECLNERGVIV